MLSALLVAYTLDFTLPLYEPDSVRYCVAYTTNRTERLNTAYLFGWPVNVNATSSMPDTIILQQHSIVGKEGTVDSFVVVDDGVPWTYCISISDMAGNMSCRTCIPVGPWVTDVPPPPPTSYIPRVLYDITGRRISGRAPPGVYFERVYTPKGFKTTKIVVLK